MAIEHPTTVQFIAKIFTRINKNGPIPEHRPDLGPCWIWTGMHHKRGYGEYHTPGNCRKVRRVHRLIFQLFVGSLKATDHCLHHCDNPPCCNPRHLWKGTHLDNMRDMAAKGRRSKGGPVKGQPQLASRGERNGNSKLTPELVRAIRASASTLSHRRTAIMFAISKCTVEKIRSRDLWAHLD